MTDRKTLERASSLPAAASVREHQPDADGTAGPLQSSHRTTPPGIVSRAANPPAALGAFIAQELENWGFHVYGGSSAALRVSTGYGVVLNVTIEKAAL